MNEKFEEWFEKNMKKLENNYVEDNWESFKEYSEGEYEVNKEYYRRKKNETKL